MENTNFKVPVTTIREIKPHSNAEKLELATVYGFQVIVPKGKFQVGSVIIYTPVDSILPSKMEERIFGPSSKVKLHKGRIRQIKLRGLASQGMIVEPNDVMDLIAEYAKSKGQNTIKIEPEQDLAEILGVTKYEPNPPVEPGVAKKRNKPLENPLFHKYGGCDNIKWQPDFFKDELVVVQEKLHGTNARYANLPTAKNTLWKKLLGLIGMLPKWEFTYGSNNVQLQHRSYKTGFYDEDVYAKMAKKYDLANKIPNGYTLFGEIIGPGIQANYHYDIPQGQHKLVLFDAKYWDGTETRWLGPDRIEWLAGKLGLESVPVLYTGSYDLEKVKELTKGNSVYAPGQKVREGVVIKSLLGYHDEYHGKRARKVISEDYLSDSSNTDAH